MMEKFFPCFVISLSFILAGIYIFPKSAQADGMIVRYDPYSYRWDYSNETNQQAFINFDHGTEKMIVSIGLEGVKNNGTVWLFPVPAIPNKVTVDIVNNLPEFNGEEISAKSKSNLDRTEQFLQITQIYMIPYSLFHGFGNVSESAPALKGENTWGILQANGTGGQQDVVVYDKLEKEGITSEIITARTVDGLYNYLKIKGLNVESGSIPVLNNYIGKDYSFIASWISSPGKLISLQDIENNLVYYLGNSCYPKFSDLINNLKQKYPEFNKTTDQFLYLMHPEGTPVLQEITQMVQNDPLIITNVCSQNPASTTHQQRGIFVAFPTDQIYFPLLPTSVYGDKTVPATVRVMGYVTPKIFPGIKNYTKTEYYINGYSSPSDLQNFYGGINLSFGYTIIDINAPSRLLTDDLWIKNRMPLKTYYSTFVANHPNLINLILLILSSVIAGILSGFFLFKDLRNNIKKLGLIGLSNCLSIIGLILITLLAGTKNKNENMETLLSQIKQRGYFRRRKIALILFILISPILILGLVNILYVIYSLLGIALGYSYYGIQVLTENDFWFFLCFNFFPLLILVVGLIFKRIRTEDRILFEQLKVAGYSSWSFQPKDKMKLLFIPLFSVVFLAVSWLLVSWIRFTV